MARPILKLCIWRCRGISIGLLTCFLSYPALASDAALHNAMVEASNRGECIDQVTFRIISERGPASAATVVAAAVKALRHVQQRQRELGCSSDIATQAIAAGADPDEVLRESAAGL